MSLTIDDHKFAVALANTGLTIGQAAERAGMSRQRFSMIVNSKRATAQMFILDTLKDQKQMEVSELDGLAKASGVSTNALKNAKAALKKDKEIHTWAVGFNPKKYLIALTAPEKPNEYD